MELKITDPSERIISVRTDVQKWKRLKHERDGDMFNGYFSFAAAYVLLIMAALICIVPEWFNDHAQENAGLIVFLTLMLALLGVLSFMQANEFDKLMEKGYVWKHEEYLKEMD